MKRLYSKMIFLALMIIFVSSAYAAERAYHIGPGDIIEISVWKDPDLRQWRQHYCFVGRRL